MGRIVQTTNRTNVNGVVMGVFVRSAFGNIILLDENVSRVRQCSVMHVLMAMLIGGSANVASVVF